MVPSASALIVLLVAVTTGKVLQGMVLIAAFGLGMALVLAGLAAATTLARNGLAAHPRLGTGWKIQRFGGVLPLATAAFIIVAGAAATLGALGNL
jgi:ABC-type nickel/cobalt efflux system permease component RcnA